MKVSLVTPSFNQCKFIKSTIDSVLSQEGEFELDYVVLDAKSTDNTQSLLESYGPRLTWRSEPDEGQVDAVNKGLKIATGEIVGWLNSDDLLLPGAIQRVVNCFKDNPDCLWVHGGCKIINCDGREVRTWITKYKRRLSLRFTRRSLLSRNFISQMTVFWRRELIEEVGLLDQTLPLAFDYDYWLRLSELGAPYYIDAPQAAFRWYDTSKSGANFAQQCREDESIARRHGGRAARQVISKRMQNLARIATYRTMSFVDRLRSTD